ncbi:hypothetical protein TMUPMC115_0419 [Tetragenococcus muriaticus PMC-11-5]|uniref:Uncharacterized protein n=1 Tax=Tetragenococcus muriaticus PMC-11-5 TaxID=1302649 RepID=A0A091CF99_9ENTE|nr:hypothetical protein [Tetragenococcus muriaticus]KFN93393.1 hypothetical protein TMUPMC115_0419 [Tetragenococcus muriaticus PMC-11-5]
MQQVITSLALTLERIAHSHWIVDEITDDTVSPAVQSLAEQIMGEIKKQTELEITDNEVLVFYETTRRREL